ncbi:MAG: hypothetical protein M1819_002074 [Sarea resinae]|nr:MAG: hypothetical protein M1819_002074 [Sarea resinae]
MSDSEEHSASYQSSEEEQPQRKHTKKAAPTKEAEPEKRRAQRRQRQAKPQEKQEQNPIPDMEAQQQKESKMAMQPFERIGGDETSMNGPVSKARADRGEIPAQSGNPNMGMPAGTGQSGKKSLDEEEGLKLKIELNLEIELELKASIRGDLTLALL